MSKGQRYNKINLNKNTVFCYHLILFLYTFLLYQGEIMCKLLCNSNYYIYFAFTQYLFRGFSVIKRPVFEIWYFDEGNRLIYHARPPQCRLFNMIKLASYCCLLSSILLIFIYVTKFNILYTSKLVYDFFSQGQMHFLLLIAAIVILNRSIENL